MAAKPDYGSYKKLVEPFVFYGSYHAHPMNQLVHIIFVPTIVLTALVFFSYLKLESIFPAVASSSFAPYLSADVPVALGYAGYYIYLCPNAVGFSGAFLVMTALLASQAYVSAVGSIAWVPAIALHILSWILQVHVGHTIYEKRAPALLDNLAQVSSPLASSLHHVS